MMKVDMDRIINGEPDPELTSMLMMREDAEGKERVSPMQAIRAKCLDCCYDQLTEVRLCPADDCPLWPFRMGRNPFRKKRTLTDEQKVRLIEQLTRARMENF